MRHIMTRFMLCAAIASGLPRGTELRGVFCSDRVVRFELGCNQGVGAGARVTVQQWRERSTCEERV